MKKIILTSILAAGFAGTLSAQTVYEGFDYTGAADVDGENGGTGWSGAWAITGGSPTVSAGYSATSVINNAFTDNFTAVGGSLAVDHNTFGVQRSFDDGTGGVGSVDNRIDLGVDGAVYFSFMTSFSTTEVTTLNFLGETAFIRFIGGSIAATLGGGTFSTTGSETYAINTPYFVVGKITTSAAGNDTMSLNVYDNSETVDATETTIVTSTGANLSSTLTGISFFQGDTVNDNGTPAYLDEFRVGTSWGAVAIPEPGTYALLAGCLALASVMVRRRR